MNFTFMIYAMIMLSVGVLFIAANSIALECGNEHPAYYESRRKDHKNFLIVTLVSAIIATLLAFPGMIFAIQS